MVIISSVQLSSVCRHDISRIYERIFMKFSGEVKGKEKVMERMAVNGFPSHSYGTSLAIWDHTVSSATRHKWTRPEITPASKLVLDLQTSGMEGWVDLGYPAMHRPGVELAIFRSQVRRTALPRQPTGGRGRVKNRLDFGGDLGFFSWIINFSSGFFSIGR